MNIDLSRFARKGEVIAVAVSGGSDSMALLNFMLQNQQKFGFKVIALNVEHGIRGDESLADSKFVEDYCNKKGISLLSFSVQALAFSEKNGLSIEESARILRYQCFFNAIEQGKCDKVATAHHLSDNFESVLINLFRGTGASGLSGIKSNYLDKIIRPFLSVPKSEIDEFVRFNSIPFVTDSTNSNVDYTRNFLRLNVIPKIKEVFPLAEQSVFRLSTILSEDEKFLESQAQSILSCKDGSFYIPASAPVPLLSRAVIFALKNLGIDKDWEKCHVDQVIKLSSLENGSKFNLPKNVIAIKEYDKICLYLDNNSLSPVLNFKLGDFSFLNNNYSVTKVSNVFDLKNGFFADLDKIPKDAVIRTKRDGDLFTKFGGGTKKLNDFFTDKKIPLKDRNSIPIIAKDNLVYFIFKIAISDLIKVDENTRNIVQFV